MPQLLPANNDERDDVRRQTLVQHLLLAALLLAAIAYWAPWIDHGAAALRLTGQDMGEFVKFLPASRGSAGGERERDAPRSLYYVPPFVSAVCLTLLAANERLVYSRWLRVPMLACAALLLLGLLPPVWGHPKELLAGEFRLQGYGLLFGFALVLGHGLFCRIPLRWLVATVIVLSLFALVAAQGAFWLVYARLWKAYNTPTISLGWGLWLHIAGWTATIGLAATIYARRIGVRRTPVVD